MLTITPDKGYSKATNFTFKMDHSILNNNVSFLWNFGDGNLSRRLEPIHTYNLPGIYDIVLSAYTNDGTLTSYTTTLSVLLYLNESIYFENVPPPTFTSHYNKYPFKINITSSYKGKHIVDLSTQFSKSYENQLPRNKWSFLRPEWKFLDLNGNIIESIETVDTDIKIDGKGKIDPNGTFVGVTGTAEFYLIDDLYNYDFVSYKKPYTTIIATLQTSSINSFHDSFNENQTLPSFSNSKAVAIMPHLFLWKYPDYIKITENGLDNLVKNKWSKAKQPIILKFSYNPTSYFDDGYGNGIKLYDENSSFCHYVPYNSSYSQNFDFNTIGISSFLNNNKQIDYIDPENNYISSGYYKGLMMVENISALNVSFSASASVKTPVDLSANLISPILWVSNPEAGLAASINYFYEDWIETLSTKNLNNAHIKIFDIPVITPITRFTFTRDNHALSGFHGGYSIAALPSPEFQAWIADGDQDTLHKVTTQGEIISSININDLFYKNNFPFLVEKRFRGQLTPASITLDSDKNLWVTLYDTYSALKFDKDGNLLFNTSPINYIGYNVRSGDWSDIEDWNDNETWNDENNPDDVKFRKFFLDSSNFYNLSGTDYDFNLIEPTCVEADVNDDVWISYSSQLSGWVIKYDKNGNLTNAIPYPINSSPKEIKTDTEGNVWIVGNEFKLHPEHRLEPPPGPLPKVTIVPGQTITINPVITQVNPFLQISGASWTLPCLNNNEYCLTSDEISSIGTIGGLSSDLFNVTFRIRGVVELASFNNTGTLIQPYVRKNITSYGPAGYNAYTLTINDGTENVTYGLNFGVEEDPNVTALDYTLNVQIKGNSQFTLYATSVDNAQQKNPPQSIGGSPYIVTDNDPNHPIVVNQPYNGQFLQIDPISWEYLTPQEPTQTPETIQITLPPTQTVEVKPARTELLGFIEKRDTNGVLLSSFGPFNNISYLTLDKDENPWFTYSYHWVGTINNKTGRFKKIKITTDGYSDSVPDWFDPNENADETALEGIASDARGNIYVIQSIENKIVVIDSEKFKIKDKFNINPKGFVYSNVNYDEDGDTQLEFNYWSKSAQAQGDWSGYRWIKKYGDQKLKYLNNGLSSIHLTGIETNLNFYLQNPFDFFKHNENFDLTKSIKDISFQPNLKNSEFLFDSILASIFGKFPYEHDDIGIFSYEKISNYVSNKSDIDTCDVDSLYDISNMIDLNTDDFKLKFPNQIKRAIDNLSINQSKLWGGRIKDDNNFKNINEFGNYNRGKLLDSNTYMVTAGVPVILNTKSLKNFKLIETGYIDENNNTLLSDSQAISTYPLSTLAYILNLGEFWIDLYEFFEYKPSVYEINNDGVIDWKSPQTLLNQQLSTSEEWFKDGGIVDTFFSYELYKGLGLLKD
jgi:hypothetical protein